MSGRELGYNYRMNLKVVSWNIAGGHPIASLEHLDYSPENLDYFIDELRKVDADIVCLQEAHTPNESGVSNAERITTVLGYPHFLNSPASVSHVDPSCQLSTAVLSRIPFRESRAVFFPNPEVDLFWKDGRPAATHEKNMQIVDFEEFTVANNQMLPLTLFGYNYQDTSYGGKLAEGINRIMETNIPQRPILWCGDFNFDNPLSIYPFMRSLGLADALPDEGTRPTKDGSKKRPDHIFYTPHFTLKNAGLRNTNSDHYLCFAELELN